MLHFNEQLTQLKCHDKLQDFTSTEVTGMYECRNVSSKNSNRYDLILEELY